MQSNWAGSRAAAMIVMTFSMMLSPVVAHAAEAPDRDFYRIFDFADGSTEFRYQARLTGVEDASLLQLLQSASQLISLQGRPPPSLVALERRARNDIDRLQKVLRSEAYYDSGIDYRIDAELTPVQVIIDILSGPRYQLRQYTITYSGQGSEDSNLPGDAASIGVNPGQSARAELVLGARRRLLETLAGIGHPLANVVKQTAVVDHADSSMSVTIEVIPGELSHFGRLAVSGSRKVEVDYVKSFISWQDGDIFDRRKLNDARNRLLGTGLFATVAFEYPNQVDDDGKLPVTIALEERKHRSIGVAGRWSTDEGFAFEGEWEHRNIFGREELLSLAIEVGEIKQEFSAIFKKPHYLRRDQDLLANGALTFEDTDAYHGPITRYFAGLQRKLSPNWNVVAGIPLEFSNLTDLQGTRDFFLYGLEFRGSRDTSNDRLDPSGGTRLRLSLNPYNGSGEDDVKFVTAQLGLTGYHAIDSAKRYILAGRTRFGSTVGESTEDLPANKRFYAGGGSSIRGYQFQSVGPLGADNTPLGGRSLFELSVELRIKFSDSLGAALFIDGGNVDDSELPDFSTDLQWAIGFGGRYFTTFGPIRLDFGFPLNPREGIDDSMQLYISIGQAF